MRVWVIMGNDFPSAVFADEAEANADVERRRAEDREELRRMGRGDQWGPRIYWRTYAFELQAATQAKAA